MPVVKTTPNSYKRNLVTAKINLESDVLKVALMIPDFTLDRFLHNNWSDVLVHSSSFGNGYTEHFTLSNPIVVNDVKYNANFGGFLISAVGGDITFGSVLIYDDTAVDKPIISSIKFYSPKTIVSGSSYAIQNIILTIGD